MLARLMPGQAVEGRKAGDASVRTGSPREGDALYRPGFHSDAGPRKGEAGKIHGKADAEGLRSFLKDVPGARTIRRSVRRADGADDPGPVGAERFQASARPGRSAAKRGEGNEADQNKLDARDPRKKTRAEQLKLEVYDQRSRKDVEAAKAADARPEEGGDAKASHKGDASRDIVVDLKDGSAADRARASLTPAGRESFSARLAERLNDVYNAEIVKQGSLVLRDGDSGTIRLLLKPESLGNVKVRLELADNHITGRIVVESEEAREAFQADLERLAKDFIDSGFQDAKLEVSVDPGAGGGAGNGREGGEAFLSMRGSHAVAFDSAETAVPVFGRDAPLGVVDILA